MTEIRPRLLLVTAKWADFDPRLGPSNVHQNLIPTLEASGLADQDRFYVDEHMLAHDGAYDEALVNRCELERPDAVMITMSRGVDHDAKPQTLAKIRETLGIPIAALFPDTFGAAAASWTERYREAADVLILQDSYSSVLGAVPDASKYLPVWTPQDPGLFHSPGAERQIDVSFLGSVARYPERKLFLGVLQQSGIEAVVGGGHGEAAIPLPDYAQIIRQSKIVLNFSRSVFDEEGFQCKGRVFEATLAGAMLVEQANPETRRWFTPGEHYVEYTNERELVEVTQHYLADEAERQAIASAGHAKARAQYSAEAYWRLVLDRLLGAS